MKVPFVCVGGLGHVHPMVPLAMAMIERGHDVRWATSPEAGARLSSLGIEAVPAGPRFQDLRVEFARRYPALRTIAPAARRRSPAS